MKKRILALLLAALLGLTACGAPAETGAPTGEIFIYGEEHANAACLDKELALWQTCYSQGMRHLFIEMGAGSTLLLNRWMAAEDDVYWDMVYGACEGTLFHAEVVADFYHQIKETCPDTIFHGFDIEHQYATSGEKARQLLEDEGKTDTDAYREVERSIKQGVMYYRRGADDEADVQREYALAANFCTAFDALGLPPKNIVAITMPCFATGEKTLKNATDLCRQMGTDFRRVDISAACTLHGQDIGHDMNNTDIAYENIQARERTQVLMDVANMEGGIVIGTGDLSELALGWCTYNGDHISHYGVNCGVPKTLVKFIVETYARELAAPDTRDTLLSILGTEITPELVPGGASTEERIGKYDLHDFFLYYLLRYNFPPRKLYYYACLAFSGELSASYILEKLKLFLNRFFAGQFKRSCTPDSARITDVNLTCWSIPSDASAQSLLCDLDEIR